MILPLKKQVCSPELAEKLKELGAPQETLNFWYKNFQHKVWILAGVHPSEGEWCAAYTVAELGELLPYAVKKEGELYFIHQTPCVGGHNYDSERFCFEFTYASIKGEAITLPIQEKTEADARAKMLIYLLKQKLISL